MEIAGVLVGNEYVRQRLEPRPGDPLYLHLKDLACGLKRFCPDAAMSILDYGCGGSPYRSLFPNAEYHRADYVKMPDMDFAVDTSGSLPDIANGMYDMVLSTQVLEHVADPALYLAEAFRVLKPGGALLLSTHGTFPDHGCPYDYWRWTADGLSLALSKAGFAVEKIGRLTCGIRAVLFWVDQSFNVLPPADRTLRVFTIRVIRKLYALARPALMVMVDRQTRHLAEMTGHTDAHVDFSVALLVLARKPDGSSLS